MLNDGPPGHPARTDDLVSVGAVSSGRGMGMGGVLGTPARATGEPTHLVDTPTATVVPTGPIVLIAVDATSISERVVHTAHRLFGEAATYLAVNVGDPNTDIVRAAHHHHADVVVIGAESRGWLSQLIDGSVERRLLHEADIAVLVVDAVGPVAGRG
jgi:nucleotide-binding universal stress UspA family protein